MDNAEEKIRGIPLGKSWGMTVGGTRVQVAHHVSGDWRVHAGWLVEEGHDDDPGSVLSPLRIFAGQAHVGWSLRGLTVDTALGTYRAAIAGGRRPAAPAGAEKWQAR